MDDLRQKAGPRATRADVKHFRCHGSTRVIAHADLDALPPGERFAPTRMPEKPILSLDLKREGIRNVIWATGA